MKGEKQPKNINPTLEFSLRKKIIILIFLICTMYIDEKIKHRNEKILFIYQRRWIYWINIGVLCVCVWWWKNKKKILFNHSMLIMIDILICDFLCVYNCTVLYNEWRNFYSLILALYAYTYRKLSYFSDMVFGFC